MTTTPEKIKTGIRAIDLMKSNEKIQKLKVIPDTVLDQQYLQVSRATDPTSKLKLSGMYIWQAFNLQFELLFKDSH